MKLLKIGLAGVRGIVGESLTPKLVMDFASAFGTWAEGRPVLVGRDTRVSSPWLRSACVSSLLAAGCDVLDLGICPTPILQYAVRRARARGGVAVTAGHNDIAWNALAFVGPGGTVLNPFQGQEVLDIYHLGRFRRTKTGGLGKLEAEADPGKAYFRTLARSFDAKAVLGARLKVVIDAANGAAAPFLAPFAAALGFELIPVNDEPNGFFPHDPEPRPRNAQQVRAVLEAVGADAGFLLSSDAGRVSVVTETGEPLSEEFTFPLAAAGWLESHPGTVITNTSTSRMIDGVVGERGGRIVRTKVGQSYAVHALLQEEAVLAGEGSGGVALAAIHPAFDAFQAMACILERTARRGARVSRLVDELPRYHIVKEKIACPPSKINAVMGEIKRRYRRHEMDLSDGIRIEDKTGWLQVRFSGTEPMVRIIAEDESRDKARERAGEAVRAIEALLR